MGMAGLFKGNGGSSSEGSPKPDYGTTGPDVLPADNDSEHGTTPPLPCP